MDAPAIWSYQMSHTVSLVNQLNVLGQIFVNLIFIMDENQVVNNSLFTPSFFFKTFYY